MTKILQINSSILGKGSVSIALCTYMTEALAREAGGSVTVRDLTSIAHFTAEALAAFSSLDGTRTPAAEALLNLSNELIVEMNSADIVVIGVPMYNFHIPSQLKSYFDFISRAGLTFRYTERGSIGLMRDKPVYLISSYGGLYREAGADLIAPYLQKMLGFLGITDTHFVPVEGVMLHRGQARGRLIEEAKERIDRIVQSRLPAAAVV